MGIIDSLIPGVVSVVTGILGQNAAEKSQSKDFNHQLEMQQRNFDQQVFMRNTQYQSAVADMQKAGLNPALAYQQGGNQAASAGGAVGGSNAASAVQQAWGNVGNFAAAMTSATMQPSSLTELQLSQAKTQDTVQSLNRSIEQLNAKYGTQVDADVLLKTAQTAYQEALKKGQSQENAINRAKAEVRAKFPEVYQYSEGFGEILRSLFGGILSGSVRGKF